MQLRSEGREGTVVLLRSHLTWLHCFGQAFVILMGFPGGSQVKSPPASAGDPGLIPALGRSPGGVNGNPLQYSCLGNPMDKGAWVALVHGLTKESDMA